MVLSPEQLGFLGRLETPFTGEPLFDCIDDVVFFLKNREGQYMVVNQTLVRRCGFRRKGELIGKRADEVFPVPLGSRYREQDDRILDQGGLIRDRLELQLYFPQGMGWCLTNKMSLRGEDGTVVGLAGISRDLQITSDADDPCHKVADVVSYIQCHLGEPIRVASLAARAGLSAYQFEQRVRRIFQVTPGQLIQKLRVDAAIEQLRQPRPSIAQIALTCGYADQSAFSRQFKQVVGLAPAEYRRSRRRAGDSED